MLHGVDVKQSVLEATWTDGAMVATTKRETINSKILVRAPVVGNAKVMATTKENVRNHEKGPRKMMQAQANKELHKVANQVIANKCQANQVVANKCLANQEVGNLDLQEAVVVVEVVVVVSAVVVEELDVVVMAVVMVSALVIVLALVVDLAVVMDKRKFVIEECLDTYMDHFRMFLTNYNVSYVLVFPYVLLFHICFHLFLLSLLTIMFHSL